MTFILTGSSGNLSHTHTHTHTHTHEYIFYNIYHTWYSVVLGLRRCTNCLLLHRLFRGRNCFFLGTWGNVEGIFHIWFLGSTLQRWSIWCICNDGFFPRRLLLDRLLNLYVCTTTLQMFYMWYFLSRHSLDHYFSILITIVESVNNRGLVHWSRGLVGGTSCLFFFHFVHHWYRDVFVSNVNILILNPLTPLTVNRTVS